MICVFLQKHFSWSSYTTQGKTEKSPLEWGGWYSDRMRGDRQRAELLQCESKKSEAENNEVIVVSNFRTKKIPSLVWRKCSPRVFASRHIKKVWEIDPLLCNHCGGLMMVSFIYEHRVIKKILAHLGLLRGEDHKRGPPAHPKKWSEIVVEPFDDGWPEYEELFTVVQE